MSPARARNSSLKPVKKGGIGVTNTCNEATLEYSVSRKVTTLLVEQMQEQIHELPDDSRVQVRELKQMARKEKNDTLNAGTDFLGGAWGAQPPPPRNDLHPPPQRHLAPLPNVVAPPQIIYILI